MPAPAAHPQPAPLDLGVARSMIGRRLLLRQPLLGFRSGTPCRVQCVVDFGDGLLLWITTDHTPYADVDQIDAEDLDRFFISLDGPAASRAMNDPLPPGHVAGWYDGHESTHTGRGLGRWLRTLVARAGGIAASLRESVAMARYAERVLAMSNAELASLGLDRAQVMDHLRQRFCGNG